eukprot:COSAG01_NODE_6994_length_3394_cov_1.567404_2_plen_175_part_00
MQCHHRTYTQEDQQLLRAQRKAAAEQLESTGEGISGGLEQQMHVVLEAVSGCTDESTGACQPATGQAIGWPSSVTLSRSWMSALVSPTGGSGLRHPHSCPTGRLRAELFLELPSRKQYPDYYALIKRPIALCTMRARMQAGTTYSGPNGLEVFVADMRLMFANAKEVGPLLDSL